MAADPCKAREPKVINDALISKCIDYQYPKGEVGRLMREEGIPAEDIKEIKFEFMNILKIDHLWVLKSLTKLQLNNNYIEKIENLETLVHLKELDLSFNKISKIENLDKLPELEKVNFFENLLEKLENMEALSKLTIISVGRNKIESEESVLYLKRFKNLVSLNMAENPVSENEDFRTYVAAFLPQLVYYEYRKISNSEREEGMKKYERELRDLQKAEEEEYEIISAIEREKADAELNSRSFVEYLNTRHLFDVMYENDEDGKAFLEMGEDMQEFYTEYETQFIKYCKQVFDVGQKHYEIRDNEIKQYTTAVDNAKNESQQESIKQMEEFLENRHEVISKVRAVQDNFVKDYFDEFTYKAKVDVLSTDFENHIHDAWKKLMKLELQLFEQMEEVNQAFEQNLADMINVFIEESQTAFTMLRSSEVTYTENLTDVANRYLTNFNLMDNQGVPDCLQSIMADKEALTNAIGGSHDTHMLTIDNREDTLVQRARHWLDTFVTQINKEEIERNRYKLREVNHFLDIQRDELLQMTEDIFLPDDDMDNFV